MKTEQAADPCKGKTAAGSKRKEKGRRMGPHHDVCLFVYPYRSRTESGEGVLRAAPFFDQKGLSLRKALASAGMRSAYPAGGGHTSFTFTAYKLSCRINAFAKCEGKYIFASFFRRKLSIPRSCSATNSEQK